VGYNPNGVANIMSLFVVKKYYRVQYNSHKQDALHVTKPDGSVMIFEPTAKGLYALVNHSTGWVHVNTVADHRCKYTKCEYRDAVLAQRVQNIIPISRTDIAATERIFGPNLGALKGKTTKRASVPVEGRIDGVPASIMEHHQQVTLAMDIMFVNKIPFLTTMS
jgi:hypothetical protein